MKKVKSFLAGFFLVNAFWLIASLLLPLRALPNPAAVYAHLGEAAASGLLSHICASLGRIFLGLLFSLLMGIPIGLFMAGSRRGNTLLHPLVYFSYPIPKTALLPIAMLLFGLGDGSKVLILSLTTVFQVIISVRDAASSVDDSLYSAAKSAGARKTSLLLHITLPAVLPELFTCLRIGTGTSLAVLFLVEAYGTRKGIGYFILDAWSRIDYVSMYGGIVAISVTGAALFLLLDLASQKICRWNS